MAKDKDSQSKAAVILIRTGYAALDQMGGALAVPEQETTGVSVEDQAADLGKCALWLSLCVLILPTESDQRFNDLMNICISVGSKALLETTGSVEAAELAILQLDAEQNYTRN